MNCSFEEFLKVDDTFCFVLEWKDVKWLGAFSKNVQVPTTCNCMWKWLLRTCCWFLIMITHEAQLWNGLCCHCAFVIDMINVICTCDNWLQYANWTSWDELMKMTICANVRVPQHVNHLRFFVCELVHLMKFEFYVYLLRSNICVHWLFLKVAKALWHTKCLVYNI
jgi:hypothetical protein